MTDMNRETDMLLEAQEFSRSNVGRSARQDQDTTQYQLPEDVPRGWYGRDSSARRGRRSGRLAIRVPC